MQVLLQYCMCGYRKVSLTQYFTVLKHLLSFFRALVIGLEARESLK